MVRGNARARRWWAPVALGSLVLSGLTVPTTAAHAVSSSVSERSLSITVDGTRYRQDYWGNGSLTSRDTSVRTAVVVVHGTSRNADDYAGYAMRAARDANEASSTLVVAPHFRGSSDTRNGRLSWTNDGWKFGDLSQTSAWRMSSFEVMDRIVDQLTTSRFPNLERIVITGHSAGGQFVQRYALGTERPTTNGVERRFVPMNAGTYAFLDDRRPDRRTGELRRLTSSERSSCRGYDRWRYGLQDRNSFMSRRTVEQIRDRYRTLDVRVLLGTEDTDRNDPNLNTSCGGMWQGRDRFERGEAYVRSVRSVLGSSGTVNVRVPGVAHSGSRMLRSPEGRAAIWG